jgi:hypothetical protein
MKKLILLSIIAVLLFVGCEIQTSPVSSYQIEAKKSEEAQQKLINSTPIPEITDSLERKNVAKRAEIFNEQNKVSYIYLINYGRIMAFYTVKGKVSSLRSYLAPTEKLVNFRGKNCSTINYSTESADCYAVEAPDLDGTYGENVSGIFFFTTDGAYVEWNGDYMMSDQPLQLTDKPALVREIK